MTKAPASSSETALAERLAPTEAKGGVRLRIEADTRRLIDDAAALLGKTRTKFMVETARRHAIDVLLDRRLFRLDLDGYDAFMHALDYPPAPGPKLRALMRRAPAWRTESANRTIPGRSSRRPFP